MTRGGRFDYDAIRQKYLTNALSLLDDADWLARKGTRFDRSEHIAWSHTYADAHARRELEERRRTQDDDEPLSDDDFLQRLKSMNEHNPEDDDFLQRLARL